ncbi:cardiolipin synthase [Croceitalea sp. MTPC9]|uniref:cardiolipin synthase n=1 Tax=unclassified Croceitalea TaxID=2632280 RepID=UPI002B39F6D1|nr:cardiolipin synthase [Croceitalea sp. MTPC6]GMN15401.1 cardiolipin synthase [Croceitalea sp. MTPC9]
MWTYLKENIWSILLGINYILVVVFSILILLKNKNPVKTFSYLFALAVFPFLGLLVYYLFGQNYRKSKIFEKKYILDNAKINGWRKKFSIDEEEREDFQDEYGDGIFKIYKLLKSNEKAILTFNNDLEILVNGEEKFARLRADLDKAESHIHMEYFALSDDELGTEILNVLCSKAKKGVKVRLIYDDVGSNISSRMKGKMTKCGVQHYPFMPVLFSNHTSKINYRNHRKIVIIDGHIGYLGGINLESKYDNTYNNERFWRDTHLRVKGNGVGSLQALFLLSWNFAAKKEMEIGRELFPKNKPGASSPKAIQIAASGPDSDWANIMEAIFCAITMAEERIYITSPYFMPNDSILTALTTAARSGVDVRVIIPYDSDSWAAQYATDSYIEECLLSGIRIFRYTKGFLHAKTILIDNMFSTIGTANMDYRSFSINFEVNAMIYDSAINQEMAKIFLKDLKECEEVELERWRERNIARRFQESFGRLWAPLL